MTYRGDRGPARQFGHRQRHAGVRGRAGVCYRAGTGAAASGRQRFHARGGAPVPAASSRGGRTEASRVGMNAARKTTAVVANAGTHNHRQTLWRGQAVAAEHITSPCGYGSRLKAGTTGERSDSNVKQLAVVIVREGDDPVFPRRRCLPSDVAEYWMPAFAGMTVEFEEGYELAFSRRFASELCVSFHPPQTEGAGKAGCWLHPWVPCNKKHGGRTTGQPEHSGFPCAMVLRFPSCSSR
jgi:hypothetical protein